MLYRYFLTLRDNPKVCGAYFEEAFAQLNPILRMEGWNSMMNGLSLLAEVAYIYSLYHP